MVGLQITRVLYIQLCLSLPGDSGFGIPAHWHCQLQCMRQYSMSDDASILDMQFLCCWGESMLKTLIRSLVSPFRFARSLTAPLGRCFITLMITKGTPDSDHHVQD